MRSEPVLIVALSGRALAASARRAGYAPIVLDAFDDLDTRACALASERVPTGDGWSFDEAALLEAAKRLAPPPTPLVWGSGFDRAPGLLEKLCRARPLLGNDAKTIRGIKEPFGFAACLADLGIPHPEVRSTPPPDPKGWLIKRVGGAGGSHVRPATAGAAWREGWYHQRRVPGRAIAALVEGDGVRALASSFSEQWADPVRGGPQFRFAGCAAPAVLPPGLRARLVRAAETVVASYRLRGLASVDFLVDGKDFHLLEVNPRPGASLDAYERAHGTSLFGRHAHACRGAIDDALPAAAQAIATMIVFARARIIVPFGMSWPAWTVDRGLDGLVIFPGDPVCNVVASGVDAPAASALARQRAERILAWLEASTAAFQARAAAARSVVHDASG